VLWGEGLEKGWELRGPNILVICGPHRCKARIDPAVVHQGRLSPGEWIVVHGCGGVGPSSILSAHAMGAQVISVDIDPEALKVTTSLGAAHVFTSKTGADLIPKICLMCEIWVPPLRHGA
jgi:D-arabinose 1-dehydrogenase-like Zn-dependent alcohol dehydrogenase